MKLPFELNLKIIFRVVLPGLVVALALLPLTEATLQVLNAEDYKEAVFVALALIGGWVVLMLDMPIYMLYEGRRFWPSWLRSAFIQSEKNRLTHLLEIDRRYHEENPCVSFDDFKEAWFDIRRFPLDEKGYPVVRFPTRLGNLIASYEEYPDTRYSMDSIFFWPRIWVILDKDLREEIDSSQARADSALYTSFASYSLGLIYLVYTLLKLFGLSGVGGVDNASFLTLLGITLIGFGGGYLLYRLGLHPQATYGEQFKAIFDIFHSKLDFSDELRRVGEITDEVNLASAPLDEQINIVWRYLQYYRVKPPSAPHSVPVPEYLQKKAENMAPSIKTQPPSPPSPEESKSPPRSPTEE